VAADLAEAEQRGEDRRVAAGVFLRQLAELFAPLFENGVVEGALFRFHRAVDGAFQLGRQVGRHHRFGTPLDERGDAGGEVALELQVALDVRVISAEGGQAAEHSGLEEIEDAPEVFRRVLQRGAGEHNPVRRVDAFAVLRVGGTGVLDMLRLVEHDEAETVMLELVAGEPGGGVGEDQEIVLRQRLPEGVALGPVDRHRDFEFRDETARFPRPVLSERRRADDQRRSHAALLARGQEREELDGFAEPHLVGEDHVAVAVGHVLEEADAFFLISAQRAFELEVRPEVVTGGDFARSAARQLRHHGAGNVADEEDEVFGGESGHLEGTPDRVELADRPGGGREETHQRRGELDHPRIGECEEAAAGSRGVETAFPVGNRPGPGKGVFDDPAVVEPGGEAAGEFESGEPGGAAKLPGQPPGKDQVVADGHVFGQRAVEEGADPVRTGDDVAVVFADEAEHGEVVLKGALVLLVAPPEMAAFADQAAGIRGDPDPAVVRIVKITQRQREFVGGGESAVEQDSRHAGLHIEAVGPQDRQREIREEMFDALPRRRRLDAGAEEVAHPADLAGGGNEEVLPFPADPAAGAPGDDLGAGDRHDRALHPDSGRHHARGAVAGDQQHRFGHFAADVELAPLAREARKIDQAVEELGGHLGIKQNLRIFRFAVDGQKTDDLLLVKRKMVELQRHRERFIEIKLAQIVEVADIIAPGALEFDGKRGVFPLAGDVGKRRDGVDVKLGLRRLRPLDQLGQALLAESAVIGGGLFLGGTFQELGETPTIQNQGDGVFAKFAGGGLPATATAGRLFAGAHPGVDGAVGQAETSAKFSGPVAPGSGQAAVLKQPLGCFQLGGAGTVLQSFFKTFLHRFPSLLISRFPILLDSAQIGT